MPCLGKKILERRQQIRTQTSPFLPHSLEVLPLQQPRKKSLSEILCFLWLVAFASDEAVQWPPVSSAKLFERCAGLDRFASRCQDHAPMRGIKRNGAVLSTLTSRARRCSVSYRRHNAIYVTCRTE